MRPPPSPPPVPLPDNATRPPGTEAVYARIAPVYDLLYGWTLQHGRSRALARLAPLAGDRVLEVGIGTGISALAYPPGCRVVAIDISAPMLARARARLRRRDVRHVTLCRMDAMRLGFGDAQFDRVYAPYVLNVVPDAGRAIDEMVRVCRPGGRLVLLNHFSRAGAGWLHRVLGRAARAAGGVDWQLQLEPLLRSAGLTATSIEHVNLPQVSSVVVCDRPGPSRRIPT